VSYLVTPGPPVDLADGRVLAPGETVKSLDLKEPHNRQLVDAGRLVERPTAKQTAAKSGEEER
jgi:hypothetical protein